MPIGVGNGLVKFNDGEEVVESDFNALQNALTLRAWEVPGYADFTAFDQFGGASGDYSQMLAYSTGISTARNQSVYTRGGGLCPSSAGFVSSLGGGFLGVWAQDDHDGYPDTGVSTSARWMRWVFLPPSAWTHVHGAAASGKYRYDLVTCRVLEGDSGTLTTRSFEDATTGALTTQSFEKQTALTLDLDAATAITVGAEGSDPAALTLPLIPAGRRLLYYVKVSSSAIVGTYDCTIPAGKLITGITFPKNDGVYRSGTWTDAGLGLIACTTAATVACIPPSQICGDPSVRILGVAVTATLNTGDTVKVQQFPTVGGPVVLADITSKFTLDGSLHTTLVDLRGLPASTSYVHNYGPVWANGATTKVTGWTSDILLAGLYFSLAATGRTIKSVTWYAIRG